MTHTLGEIAQRFGLELRGDGAGVIEGVCTLTPGQPGRIAFLANPKLRAQLAQSRAGAVIVGKRDAQAVTGSGLVASDPYLAYARIAALFDRSRDFVPGIHPSAVVAADARIGEGCHIGPQVVIESSAAIGAGSFIGPGSVVGRGTRIGAQAYLVARVSIGHEVRIGDRCQFQPGAVIGSRGFGNAPTAQGWVEVPQLGTVTIGDDVEVGANTTIDRGAIDDTVIENGVRLDNLIQIAHNVRIGAHTAIAACTGVAGSTRIGSRCMIGGAAVINGHIEIGDDVIIMGYAMVTKSVPSKSAVGSGMPALDVREWRKQVARVRRLERLDQRLRSVEDKLGMTCKAHEDDGE